MSHAGDYELAWESLRARSEEGREVAPRRSVSFSHLPRCAALGQRHSLADPHPTSLRGTQMLASLKIRSGVHSLGGCPTAWLAPASKLKSGEFSPGLVTFNFFGSGMFPQCLGALLHLCRDGFFL